MAKKTNFDVNEKSYFRVTRTIEHKADGTAIRKNFYGSGINEANGKADENGEVMEARKLFRKWSSILKNNNIEHKKFHALRHTYATLLLSKGVDLLTVSKLLGHSSIQITEIYTHIIPSLKINAVNKINDIF